MSHSFLVRGITDNLDCLIKGILESFGVDLISSSETAFFSFPFTFTSITTNLPDLSVGSG